MRTTVREPSGWWPMIALLTVVGIAARRAYQTDGLRGVATLLVLSVVACGLIALMLQYHRGETA